jgi:hypothetical protein
LPQFSFFRAARWAKANFTAIQEQAILPHEELPGPAKKTGSSRKALAFWILVVLERRSFQSPNGPDHLPDARNELVSQPPNRPSIGLVLYHDPLLAGGTAQHGRLTNNSTSPGPDEHYRVATPEHPPALLEHFEQTRRSISTRLMYRLLLC